MAGLKLQKFIISSVFGSEHFDGVNVWGVFGEDHLREEEHLVGEDFIAVEVAAEEAGVAVGQILAFVEGDVGHLAELGMQLIVLSISGVEVGSSIFVRSIFSQNSLKQFHGKIIRMSDCGGFEEDTNVNIGHFIITHVEHWGREIRFFSVRFYGASRSFTGEITEMLLNSG
jgi:hypothetical protein